MSEILLLDSLIAELTAVKNAAAKLKPGSTNLLDNKCTKPTEEFTSLYTELLFIIGAYQNLILQDVGEVEQFYRDMQQLDQSMS